MQTRSVNQLVCVATIIILFPCNDAGIGNTSHCCHHLTADKTGSFWVIKITCWPDSSQKESHNFHLITESLSLCQQMKRLKLTMN